jgi:hypothetical protein
LIGLGKPADNRIHDENLFSENLEALLLLYTYWTVSGKDSKLYIMVLLLFLFIHSVNDTEPTTCLARWGEHFQRIALNFRMYRPWSVLLHQWNAERFARNDWNGERNAERFARNDSNGEWNAERFARNDSNGERLERFGCDLRIYISETLAVYYCRYLFLIQITFV